MVWRQCRAVRSSPGIHMWTVSTNLVLACCQQAWKGERRTHIPGFRASPCTQYGNLYDDLLIRSERAEEAKVCQPTEYERSLNNSIISLPNMNNNKDNPYSVLCPLRMSQLSSTIALAWRGRGAPMIRVPWKGAGQNGEATSAPLGF